MFQKLQQRWKVGFVQVILILCTFAIGGSICGYLTKKIMDWLPMDKNVFWWVLYIIVAAIIWPVCVLVLSIPFGQFRFFKKYTSHIVKRLSGKKIEDEQN